MAYGLKYFSRYRNYDGVIKRVRLYKIDFTGEAIEWTNDRLAVTFTYGDSDSFFPDIPLIASQARIGFIFSEQYDLSEFVFDRKTFFCEIYNEVNSRVEWSGWVEPWNAQHDYSKPPYTATLTVSCGLAHLSKIKYVNPNTVFKKTGLQLIQECLAIMGSQLNLRVSTHMIENSFGGAAYLGLTSFEINTARYYDENGEAMHCDQIVNDILNKFNAEILQWDNRWVVRAIVDHSTGAETTFIEYPFGGGSTVSLPWPATYEVNTASAFSLDGGVVCILAPITKYRTEVDLGTQLPYFENGNMLIWTDSGLVGWDFSHMPKGNPGWERYYIGTENTLSVLKINGKSPQPYRKKKKKKLIKILIPILTGAIGANLKNTYYDVEPAQWIESSAGKISKGDKTLKVSFDYETAAFSGDILISVRFPMAYAPFTTRWLNPGSKNSGLSDEFVLIRVPPVNRENLISRGFINVSGNPNYPSGTTINWTYVVQGVPDGQTRKIGGASGVNVENGDLIISKIANSGGTQAAVGSSWEVINIRNNVKRGTFECEVFLDKINFLSPTEINKPIPHQEVFIRFYKLSDGEGRIGDWYKVYNLRGALEGFVASDESSKYATTLERGSKTDEEAETIHLITGDYNPWFSGSMTKPGSQDNTSSWKRRTSLNEGFSIYRAMMLDRICMTSRPLDVVQADITLRAGAEPITYLHTLIMKDIDNMRMRIVRFEFQDTSRIVGVTAVEVKYEEVPADQLRQDSYIPGSRTLNTIPGQGDGVYPTKEDSTNGRISAEDLELTDEELIDVIDNASRLAPMFENIDPLTYLVGEESTESVDLADYLSETFTENNEDQEEEDLFDPETLVLSLVDKPVWVSKILFEKLEVTATALAPKIGNFYLTVSAYDEESDTSFEFRVPILVEPSEDFIDEWPPKFIDVPPMYFIAGKNETKELFLKDFLDPEGLHDGTGLSVRMISKPAWVTETGIVFMNLFVGGESPKPAVEYISYQFSDAVGNMALFAFELITLDAAFLTYVLMNTSGALPVEIGELPGVFPLPAKWDVELRIKGNHTKYLSFLKGGGANSSAITRRLEQTVNLTNDGHYRFYREENGVVTAAGQFELSTDSYLDDAHIYGETIDFVLYDEAFAEAIKFYMVKTAVELGEILLDGTSSFIDPQTGNIKIAAANVSHDKAVMVLEFGGEVIKTTPVEHEDPETDFEYLVYTSDQPLAVGKYTIRIRQYLGINQVSYRYANFEIVADKPQATPGLKLITNIANTTDYKILAELPETGSSHVLPDNWALLCDAETDPYGFEIGEVWQLRADKQFKIDLSLYTGQSDSNTFANPVTFSDFLLFRGLSSLRIGKIHVDNTTFRARITRRATDENSEIVAIIQADFSFGPFVPIDDKPISEPGTDIADYVAGAGMGERIENYVKILDVRVDGETLEIFQPESPDDQENPDVNHIQVKEKGILFEHLQDIPGKHVIGNTNAVSGTPFAVPIVKVLEGADPDDLPDVEGVKDYIEEQLNERLEDYALRSRRINAGAGMTGGGDLSEDRTITMGAPSKLNATTINQVTGTTHTHEIDTDDLIAGSNVVFSGSGSKRLTGLGPLTLNVTQVPWGIVISRPTTLSGYGIDISVDTTLTGLLGGKENNFSKGDLIAGAGINLSGTLTGRLVGPGNVTITCTVSGSGVGGSGVTGYFALWTSSTNLGVSVMRDTGTEINIANTRSFGVEGPAAMRNYLHVWGYASFGTASNHGSLVIHNQTSAVADPCAALEIISTTKGFLGPRMTYAQRHAIASPEVGLKVFQTDVVGSSPSAEYTYYPAGWFPTQYGATAL